MRVLAFAASRRQGSVNRRLIELCAAIARERDGVEVDLADFREWDLPVYDGDIEREHDGLPPAARQLADRIEAAHALIIAAPEYNFSIAGPLKNAIDWVSRARPVPFRGRSVLLVSSSPGPMGGIRGLWQTRVPLEGLGSFVFPDMFALAGSTRAFADDGSLLDEGLDARLRTTIHAFLKVTYAVATLCGEDDLEQQTSLQPAPAQGDR